MACVAKQARLIAEIFHDQYTVIDDDIFSACYTLARCGYTPDVLVGSKDEHALGLFNLCVNAANDARTLRAKLEEAQAD